MIKNTTGHIKPRSEAFENELELLSQNKLNVKNVMPIKPQEKTEIEKQAELEQERGWIRNLNSKLYDNNLKKLIADCSNGADVLKTEVRSSQNRLKAVKSGIPLSNVVPHKDDSYFIPDLESYFKGPDRL